MSLRWYHLSKKHNDSYQIYVLKKCEDDLFVYLLFKYYYHENLHCRWFIFQSFIIIYYHPKNFLRHFFEAIQKNDDDFYKRFVTLKRSNIFFHFSWFSNLMIFHFRIFIVVFLNQIKKLSMTLKSGFFTLISSNFL